jgi:hypothetical protein
VPKIEDDDWDGSIRDLAPRDGDARLGYVAAWGTFASAADIPPHFVKRSTDETRSGRLTATSSRNDLILVTEHVWEETLTNPVTLNDFQLARREVAHLMLAVFEDVLREELGPDYDFDGLMAWLRSDGVQWFEELTNVYLETALRRSASHREVFEEEVAALAAQRGLPSLEQEVIARFAAVRIQQLVRKRDGNPPSEETVRDVLRWIGLAPNRVGDDELPPSPFEAAGKRVIERRYGGEEAFAKRVGALADRIIGVYGPFAATEQFRGSVTMPGIIVESTGTLLDEHTTVWTFSAADAYPFGYRMRARSFERNPAVTRLLGAKVLTAKIDLIEFARRVDGDEELKTAMKRSLESNSTEPLRDLRRQVEAADNAARRKSLTRVFRLLGL